MPRTITERSEPGSPARPVYTGELFTIGIFRCPVDHPFFSREATIGGAHHIVFPRTSVLIEQAGRRPVVADPNVAIYYNDSQVYSRRKLSPRGDHCDYFTYASRPVVDALSEVDPGAANRVDRPFVAPSGPVGASTYLAQRSLLSHALRADWRDPLAMEEAALWLLHRVVSDSMQARANGCVQQMTCARQRDIVSAAHEFLAHRFASRDGLTAIARALGCSEFHLCRMFRRHTGRTLSSYRNQLRLRTSLELLLDTALGLTDIALDLGYSSHSHFTSSFRHLFGLPPSQLRQTATAALVRTLSKNLIAPLLRTAE